jgi:tripartite ATP-independent transporter DctP family solute receptor
MVFFESTAECFLYIQDNPKRRKKMKRKSGLLICIAILGISLLLVNSVAFGADKVIKLTFGSASSKGLPTYTALEKWAELVQQRAQGRVQILTAQERKLGGDKDMIELVGSGALEGAHCSSAMFDGFTPALNALQMPFLINDYDMLKKVFLANYTMELLSAIKELKLQPLGLIENGYRHIGNNTRPITNPADLKGLKIRVGENKMHEEIFSALGAIPVPISYGEIYTSMQTGVINGTEINATSASSEKLMEVIKYFSLTGHFFWPSVAFMNVKVWDGLPKDIQKIFSDTWREIIPWQIDLCKGEDEKAMKVMEGRGIKINQADSRAFYEGSKFVYDKYMKDPRVAKFVKAVQAMQKK